MAKAFRVTVSGSAAVSNPFNPDYFRPAPFAIGVGVTINSTGTVAYYVEHSFDPIFDLTYGSSVPQVTPANATWFQNSGITSSAGSTAPANSNHDGNYAFPVTAIRLNVSANSSQGSVTMSLIQSGV
jgi:hypothetical protein